LLSNFKGTIDQVIDIPDVGQFYYEKFTDGMILQGIKFVDYYALRTSGTSYTRRLYFNSYYLARLYLN